MVLAIFEDRRWHYLVRVLRELVPLRQLGVGIHLDNLRTFTHLAWF